MLDTNAVEIPSTYLVKVNQLVLKDETKGTCLLKIGQQDNDSTQDTQHENPVVIELDPQRMEGLVSFRVHVSTTPT